VGHRSRVARPRCSINDLFLVEDFVDQAHEDRSFHYGFGCSSRPRVMTEGGGAFHRIINRHSAGRSQ
jgi:hypothetical protein